MRKDYMPILVVTPVSCEGGMKFLHENGQIEIDSGDTEELWQILEHCNGYNTIAIIAQLSGIDIKEIEETIETLVELGLVVDVREQYSHFHAISSNVDYNQRTINGNTRWKEVKNELSSKQVISVCRSLYNEAGLSSLLYEVLRVFVLVEKEQNGCATGYYEYDVIEDTLVWFDDMDEIQLSFCFNQTTMPYGTAVQIVLAVDFDLEENIDNHDYRVMLMEIGRKAEWLEETIKRRGLKLYEVRDFQDKPLKEELGMNDHCWPMMTLALTDGTILPEREEFDKMSFVRERVGEEYPVKGYFINSFGSMSSFFGVTTVFRNGCGMNSYAGGTGTTTDEAVFKAVIEGYERWVSGQVRVDYHGSAKHIDGRYLNPYKMIPLTSQQVEESGLTLFNEELSIDWTIGRNYKNEGIFIPSDIVYYGQKPSENQIYRGHSSGIAAYTDLTEAKKRALVELIERDALMRNWFLRESPRRIDEAILPLHIQKRIKFWRKHGRKMMVLELDSDYGWVYEVIVTSKNYPCFVSGAAATIERSTIGETILKAMEEAEYNLLLAMRYPRENKIDDLRLVTVPMMHGMVYHFEEYAKSLSWLWQGEVVSGYREQAEYNMRELNTMLKLVTVDLSIPGDDLKVVRVFSSKLVPISFGFSMAHFSHPEIRDKVASKSVEMPHYFA